MYKANDTKYRYVKLNRWPSLNKWLGQIDSSYIVYGNMRNAVIAREELNQKKFKMMQKSMQLEKKAKELKQKLMAVPKKSKYYLPNLQFLSDLMEREIKPTFYVGTSRSSSSSTFLSGA